MLNKDFYPTPEKLIEEMIAGIDFRYISSILEPSAGSGNIVDYLENKKKDKWSYSNNYHYDIDCIEIDDTLKATLKGKGHHVVYNDFLTFNTYKQYDLIIANFPFSNGCKHFLKAIEMQEKNGGCIVALINAETLKNAYSNERDLLVRKLNENNADIKYIQNAFVDAERKTNVEIALVKVIFPKKEQSSFIFDGLRKAKEVEEVEYSETGYLAENDLFKSIVAQYNMELEAGIKFINEYYAMRPFILNEFKKDENGNAVQYGGSILDLTIDRNSATVNNYIKKVRKKYWTTLFNNPKFIGNLTENLRKEFMNKIDDMQNYDFSLYNIYELRIEMSKNVVKGIEDTIISLFDEMTHKHHYYDETSNNVHYFNGWKTNKAYIINKKVILPLNAWHGYWNKYEPTSCCSGVKQKLMDIEKCFNYLDGGRTECIDLENMLSEAEKTETTKNIKLKYFTITFYKKGTAHITFTNEELLKKFNIYGAQNKGWLPPCYGKKHYSEMDNEEKEVIKEFDGSEREYENVIINKDYFLVDSNSLLLAVNE